MKTTYFVRLERQLIESMPGWAISGPMIVMCPLERVLRGVAFEGSSFDAKTFFVWFFFLPLCVPTKHLYFNFGERLRTSSGGDVWNTNDTELLGQLRGAISDQALPYLSGVESLEGMIQKLNLSSEPENPHKQQAIAYALARGGKFEEAREALAVLISQLDDQSPWQQEISERAKWLQIQLENDTTQRKEQLEKWEAETTEALKLAKVCL